MTYKINQKSKTTLNSRLCFRSQLATIVMAGINDVTGVCVGGVLGHFVCTGLAGRDRFIQRV